MGCYRFTGRPLNMRRIIGLLLLAIGSAGIGFGAAFLLFSQNAGEGSSDSGESEILYWVAPMDPNYRRDKPGKSPMGMDLVPVYAGSAPAEPDMVEIDPRVVQNLGVRTERVALSPLDRKIRTVGYVEYDENSLHHVHTRVDGWIEKLSVKAEGDPVTEGQVLFEIYSPTLVAAQEEYLLAKASGSSVMTSASKNRLNSLGLTDAHIDSLDSSSQPSDRIKMHARSDGVVGMLGVREGIFVTPATHAMSIAVLESVWIVAEVLERQAGYVEVGQPVDINLDALPGMTFKGEIDYIYPELDAVRRSLMVRVAFDSKNEVLRPNMYARVTIFVPGSEELIHVPRSAVIRGGLSDRVVLDVGNGMFRTQPVVLGIEIEDRVQVLEGLDVGEKVVTSGQFLIDSESDIEAALARFEEEKAQAAAPNVQAVNAIVRSTNPENMTIRARHDAVPDWGWMKMTMNIKVAEKSLLEGRESGEEVILDIEKKEDGSIVVFDIRGRDEVKRDIQQVKATVRSTNPEEMTIRARHDAVPDWGWMKMTMNIKVAEESLLEGRESGEEVVLEIEKKEDGSIVIVSIRPQE